MERTTQKQDDQLLHYLDGKLTETEKSELEILLKKNNQLDTRLEELRLVHNVLNSKGRLEQPSKVFTERVMANLDHLPVTITMSPKKGLLLLCGILVAMSVLAILLSLGVFDNMSDTISLEKLPLKKEFIKNPLPAIPFNLKWVINGVLILTIGLAFVLLDRTILKPFFERRSKMQF